MTTERRRIYKKMQQRKYRENNRQPSGPKETTVKATESGAVSLVKAGLVPGTRYFASPRPGGSILLQPLPEDT